MSSALRPRALRIDGRTPSPPTLRQLVGQKVHIYYFQSPKNHRRLVLCDQLVFFLAILLEADPNVASYSPGAVEPPIEVATPCLTACLRSGEQIGYIARYAAANARALSAFSASMGAAEIASGLKMVTDHEIRAQQVKVENWIFLCSAMSRAKDYSCIDEARTIRQLLDQFTHVDIGMLLGQDGIDQACMLAAIGRGLQAGTLTCDTSTTPLTRKSIVSSYRGAP